MTKEEALRIIENIEHPKVPDSKKNEAVSYMSAYGMLGQLRTETLISIVRYQSSRLTGIVQAYEMLVKKVDICQETIRKLNEKLEKSNEKLT